ncbi:P-loop NTPase fold protein [Tenacibaculum maritimum]
MIKEQFQINKSKDYILIDFNPWLNISLNSILQDFFNTLEKSLKEYSFDVSKNIRKYSNSVLSIHKNDVTESVLKGINLILKSSLTEEFNNLNDLLKKLNKRIVIIIDDFDRLQANEIFEILKLIRNTAGFDTFTYVVAYDKEYLVKSLKNNNIPNPEKFTEKIFKRNRTSSSYKYSD